MVRHTPRDIEYLYISYNYVDESVCFFIAFDYGRNQHFTNDLLFCECKWVVVVKRQVSNFQLYYDDNKLLLMMMMMSTRPKRSIENNSHRHVPPVGDVILTSNQPVIDLTP